MIVTTAPAGAGERTADKRARNWRICISVAVAVGLGIRLASVLLRPHVLPGGDPLEYVGQANLLTDGKGWIDPLLFMHHGLTVQTAKLPPFFTLLMAACSAVGFKSFFAHRVWSAILGSVAVPVAAMLGREVSGRKVGMLAAVLVAVYPNMWLSDGLVMSETISPIMAMLVVWAGYRMLRQPTPRRAAVLGVAIGFAALTRDELILLAVLVLLPVALLARQRTVGEKLKLAVVGGICTVLVIAPWVGFNLSRFSHRALISDQFGLTVAAANCDSSWHGQLRAYWSMPCALASATGVKGDESAVDPVALRKGLRYIGRHLGGLPSLEFDRLGRTFGFYRPLDQIHFDSFIEGRPELWSFVGLGMFYGFAAGSVVGAVLLRRRGVPVFPMIAVGIDVIVAVLLTYGQTRFRASLEPMLVILTSVVIVGLTWRGPASPPAPSGPT